MNAAAGSKRKPERRTNAGDITTTLAKVALMHSRDRQSDSASLIGLRRTCAIPGPEGLFGKCPFQVQSPGAVERGSEPPSLGPCCGPRLPE
eukprot:3823664-Amphidinium_carterae.1